MNDDVNHPKHYTSHPSGVECITVVEHMTFNLGNAVKYIWRAGMKDPANPQKDLDKAIWYLQREKQRLAAGLSQDGGLTTEMRKLLKEHSPRMTPERVPVKLPTPVAKAETPPTVVASKEAS